MPRDPAAVLSATSLFASLDSEALGRLAAAAVRRSFARGQYLFYQGDPADRVFIVASGLVKIVLASELGDEMVLNTLGPADVVGEMGVLDLVPRSASAVAVKASSVLILERPVLVNLMHNEPAVMKALLATLSEQVRRLSERAGELAFLDLGGRLAKLLVRFAIDHGEESGGAVVLDLGLSQGELAAMVGASRPAVNKALRSLKCRGLIELNGRVIVLRDMEALRRRAG